MRLALVALLAGSLVGQTTARFERLYREALARREARYGAEDSRTGVALVNLALFPNEHERPQEAEPLLRRAAAILDTPDAAESLAGALEGLTDVRLAQGDGTKRSSC